MNNLSTGIYKLRTVLNSDILWYKDNSSALPFKYEYSQKFLNQIDKIILADKQVENTLLFCKSSYLEDEKIYLDYGHWELLMLLMLLSLLGEKSTSNELKEEILSQYLLPLKKYRFNWKIINDFYENELLKFNLHSFIKKSDDELSEVEKVLRDVAEASWEYTNCIEISNDESIKKFIDKLFEYGRIMVIMTTDKDQSLAVAASMYGSFEKIIATNLSTLDSDWQEF